MNLILASKSPRRKEILSEYGFNYKVIVSDYKENAFYSDPVKTVIDFSLNKAESVYKSLKDNIGVVVLGFDTVVYHNGVILGKPTCKTDAIKTLNSLSGKKHFVYSGFCLISEKFRICGYDSTEVLFNVLTKELIDRYVNSEKPMDKAGSYGIQDGFDLVKSINGSLYNVIGLPIEKILPCLRFSESLLK